MKKLLTVFLSVDADRHIGSQHWFAIASQCVSIAFRLATEVASKAGSEKTFASAGY